MWLILMIALTLAPGVGVSQAFSLGGEDFDKLRKAAIGGEAPGRQLHSKVVAVFGLVEKMPITELKIRTQNPITRVVFSPNSEAPNA